MKKTILYILFIIITISLYLTAAITLSDYRRVFEDFSRVSNIDLKIASNLKFEIRKFPRPGIIIKEVIDNQKIEIYNAEINFSPLSILMFRPKISSVSIGEIKIFIRHGEVDLLSHAGFISEIIDRDTVDLKAFIKRLEFTEAANTEDNIVINDFIFNGASQETQFAGRLEYIGNIKGYFKFDQTPLNSPNKTDKEGRSILSNPAEVASPDMSIVPNAGRSSSNQDELPNGQSVDSSDATSVVSSDTANQTKQENTLFYLTIQNEDLNFELSELYQKHSISNRTYFKGGKVDIRTKNIMRFAAQFGSYINQFFGDHASDEETHISFMISPEDEWTYLKKINVESESINCKGEIAISKNDADTNKVDLHFTKIDFDNLKKFEKAQVRQDVAFFTLSDQGFNNKKSSTKVLIDQMKLNETSTLSNIAFEFEGADDKFDIKKFSGNIGNDGSFKISGYITHNQFRSIFNGNITLSHTDINEIAEYISVPQIKTSSKIPFVLASDLKCSSVDISLQNMSLRTADSELTGSASVKFIGNSPRVNANLNLSNADLDRDNFPGLRYILSAAESIIKDTKDENYLSKFATIRNINLLGSFNISINDLKLYNRLYDNIRFSLSLLPGELLINKLYISYDNRNDNRFQNRPIPGPVDNKEVLGDGSMRSGEYIASPKGYTLNPGKDDISTLQSRNIVETFKNANDNSHGRSQKDFIDISLNLRATGIKPVADIVVHDGSLKITNFKVADILNLRDNISKNISFDKFHISTSGYFTKIYNDDFDLGRVIIIAGTQNNLIDINKFEGDIFGGRFKASGSILVDPFTINFVYGITSASINSISDALLGGYIKTGGVISSTGMWTTNGDSVDKLLYNLYTKSSIVTKDLSVENFSIDDFVLKVNRPDYALYNLEDDVRQAMLTGDTKISDMISDIELNEGIIKFSGMKFKSKYSAAAAAALINIYDLSVNLNSKFSFLVNPTTDSISYSEYLSSQIDLTLSGNLFSPKKDTKFNDLITIIKEREKNTQRRRGQ